MAADPLAPLWQALAEAAHGPDAPTLDRLPPPGALPPPWQTWLLIGLFRHRRRQLWVGEVVSHRLSGDLDLLSTMGALGHPQEIPRSGLVPGMTDWEYYFHGIGCCLTRRSNGEAIDVDFFGGSAEYFDFFFYRNFLKSLREPEPPEARLIALHPSRDSLDLDYRDLQRTNALVTFEGSGPCRLSDEAMRHTDAVEGFCGRWANPVLRPGLAAHIGDWGAASAEATAFGDATLASLAAGRAAEERSLRRERLAAAFADTDLSRVALAGLNDLGVSDLRQFLRRALHGPVSGTMSTALAIIRGGNDAFWCDEVWALLGRLNCSGPPPHPHLYNECLGFLLGHDFQRPKLVAALSAAGGYGVGDAALLALEHAPEAALPLLRRALRSDVPNNRITAAAVLALIDRPWSRRELLAVLEESDDQQLTSEARAALLETRDPAAPQAVRAWEQRFPHEPETGPFITMREMMLRGQPERIRYEMEKLHDRVMRIRERIPPEAPTAPKRWWKLWGN
jgi:hypothetical protein